MVWGPISLMFSCRFRTSVEGCAWVHTMYVWEEGMFCLEWGDSHGGGLSWHIFHLQEGVIVQKLVKRHQIQGYFSWLLQWRWEDGDLMEKWLEQSSHQLLQLCRSRFPRTTIQYFALFDFPFSSVLTFEMAIVGRALQTMGLTTFYCSSEIYSQVWVSHGGPCTLRSMIDPRFLWVALLSVHGVEACREMIILLLKLSWRNQEFLVLLMYRVWCGCCRLWVEWDLWNAWMRLDVQ